MRKGKVPAILISYKTEWAKDDKGVPVGNWAAVTGSNAGLIENALRAAELNDMVKQLIELQGKPNREFEPPVRPN